MAEKTASKIQWPLRIFRTCAKISSQQNSIQINVTPDPKTPDETIPMRLPLIPENKLALNSTINKSFNGFVYFFWPEPFSLETFYPTSQEMSDKCEAIYAAETKTQRQWMAEQGFFESRGLRN